MKHLAIVIFLFFSCKKENKIGTINKDESLSIEIISDKIKDEKKLDSIKSFIKNDTLFFQLKGMSISFLNNEENCWKNIQITDIESGIISEIETPIGICFEKNSISDFSPNQNFLMLHAIEKGILSDGNSERKIEKYNCMFLDIKRKVVSEKYSDLFCSGEWTSSNQWFIDEDEHYEASQLFDKL